jgi:HK97 gp10 family phage protein
MAKQSVTIIGMPFVLAQLKGFLPRESKAVMRRTTTGLAAKGRDAMRQRAPKDSGTLRKAIVSKRRRGARGMVEAAIYITKGRDAKHDAFYWHMVEWGTLHSRPQPFASPVVEDMRASYRQDLAAEFDRQVVKQLEKRARRQGLTR